MAMNKYGRFSPKTTDPKTGARIADPEVYGQTLPDNSKVSSWPELRTMFKSGKLNEQFFGKGGTKEKPTGGSYSFYPSDVKNYLEGKTDKLDDINYEEPVISEDYAETGSKRKITYAHLDYKVNSPKWKSIIKKTSIPGEKYTPSQEGVNQQVYIGSTGGWGEAYGASTIRDRKSKPETKTPEPIQKTTLEPIPKLNERKPKPMKYLEDITPVSEGEWESPVPSKYGVSIDKSREGGQGGKWGLRKKIVGPSGDKKSRASLGINITKGGGRREEKMAKSFYAPTSDLNHGSYYSSMSETSQDDLSKSIRSQVKDIKSERKDWKSKTSLTGADKKEGMSMYKQDIKTGRLAARYAKKGDLYSTGGNEWSEGSGSKLRTWTPDQDKLGNRGAMSEYVKSAKQNIKRIGQLNQAEQRNITNANIAESNRSFSKKEKYIKSAEDNATNRNSTQARMNEFWGWNKFGK